MDAPLELQDEVLQLDARQFNYRVVHNSFLGPEFRGLMLSSDLPKPRENLTLIEIWSYVLRPIIWESSF